VPARLLEIISPAGFEKFFDTMTKLAGRGDLRPVKLVAPKRIYCNRHFSTSIVMKSGNGRTQPYCVGVSFTRRFEVYLMPFDSPCSKTTLATRALGVAATGV
jgi:hypothetical protein